MLAEVKNATLENAFGPKLTFLFCGIVETTLMGTLKRLYTNCIHVTTEMKYQGWKMQDIEMYEFSEQRPRHIGAGSKAILHGPKQIHVTWAGLENAVLG